MVYHRSRIVGYIKSNTSKKQLTLVQVVSLIHLSLSFGITCVLNLPLETQSSGIPSRVAQDNLF